MKNIFLSILLLLTVSVCKAQYNPSNFTVSNKAYGVAQAVPTDARSFYYDGSLFVMRPYQSTAEVLSYLNLTKYRIGNFPIYVNVGGTLQSGGTFTGGTLTEYWFRDGTADGNLVAKLVPETDPKRVTGVVITGTTTKTVTITLADASTVTGTFTDLSGASTPTLQQVSDVGHTTTTDITANNFRGASVILNSNGGGGVSAFTNTDGDLNINYGKDGGNVVLAKGTTGTFRDTITKSGTIAMISDLPTGGGGSTDTTHLSDRINLKVDKVTGKQLSTEDYSTAEKTKLAGITGTNTGDQDLSSYLTSSTAATTYFPLTGGALTGTAGSGYIGLIPQSSAPSAPATGVRLYARSTGAFSWIGTNGFTRSILGTYLTGDHVWQLQNKDGTFADSAAANLDSIYRYGIAASKGFLPVNFQSPTTILTPSGTQGHLIGLGMDVAFDTKRNLWVMLYANWDGTGTNTTTGGHDIWGATSPDLITWTKVGTTPIISRGASGATDFGGLTFPQLYYEESTSTWHCYMIAFPTVGFEVGPSVIIHATATDLLGSWTKTGTVLSAPSGWLQSGHYVFRPNVVKNGSTYYMFFNGGAYGNERFGYATSSSAAGPFTASASPIIAAGTKAAPWCANDFFSDPNVFYYQGKWYCAFWSNDNFGNARIGMLWTSKENFPTGWKAYDNIIDLGTGNQQRPTIVQKEGELYLFHNDGSLSAMNIKVATTKTGLYLDGTGQLGINTLAPSAKLHVLGDNGSSTTKSLVVFGDDLSAVTDVNRAKVTVGNTDGFSEILVGQSSTRNMLFNWSYNSTAASAFGVLSAYGGSNDIKIQNAAGAGNTILNESNGGVVIGGSSRNASAALQIANTTKGFLPPVLTTTQRGAVATPATGLSVYNSTLGQNNTYNGAAWTGDVVVSAAATLSLLHGGDYIFTGTTTTWTLPAISATTVGRQNGIYIKNRGSGAITLNSNTGSTLYTTLAVGTLTINAGEGYLLLPDGTYFSVMGKY